MSPRSAAVISEVGAVMLVGGNIEGKTRVLTTAIVLNTRTGDFAQAISLGIVLLALALRGRCARYCDCKGRRNASRVECHAAWADLR